MSELLFFYYGSHPDHRGRTLAEIVQQDDDWLEQTHDFIQWLFPLSDLSRASSHAPLVDARTAKAFLSDDVLQSHMRIALNRMLRFLGLQFDGQSLHKGPNWTERKTVWFVENGHNSLRITRMLKSMCLLGLRSEAVALHDGLQTLCDSEPDCGITEEARGFWRAATN